MKNIYDISNIICREKITGHEGPVETVCIDERIIVSGSRDKTIRVWDRNTRECLGLLMGHEENIKGIAMNKQFIVSCGIDKTIRIWNRSDYTCLKILKGHSAGVECIDIKGDLIASGSSDFTIKLWNLNSGELIRTFEGHKRIVSSVKIRGNLIYSGSWDHYINTWDIESGKLLSSFEAHFDAIQAIEVNTEYIISCDQSRLIRIWDINTYKMIRELNKHYQMVMDLNINGNWLYSCSQDSTVLIWDIKTGILLKRLEGHTDAVMSVDSFGNTLVSVSTDGTIRIWDDNSTQSELTLEGHEDIVLGLATNGKEIASVGTEHKIFVWDFKKEQLIREINVDVKGWIWGIAIENEKVIVSGDDGIYRIFNIHTGEPIGILEKHDGTTYRPSLKNNIALTPSFDTLVKIWNIETGEQLKNLIGHNFSVYTTAFIRDNIIASSGSEGYLKIWNMETGECLKTFKDHTNEIFHIASDNNLIATACADRTIRIYDIDKMECIHELLGHDDQVWSIQIKKGFIFSGCLDSTIKIWSIEKGTCVETIYGHDGAVKDLCILDDYLISGSKDGLIKAWNMSKYIGNISDRSGTTRISEKNEIIASLLQIGRAYEIIPNSLGNPDIIRYLYGLKPLDTGFSEKSSILEIIKNLTGDWRTLGHLGVGIWYDDIIKALNSKNIKLDEDEVLESIIHEFSLGLAEAAPMYWFGILRYVGSNLKSIIPNQWTYSLEFSGEGPTPITGFNWTKLKIRNNKVELGEREETALIFRLNLSSINEWLIPLLKSIEILVKDDRGDNDYILFDKFLPDENGNWSAISMFKIDDGYKSEPNAIIELSDVIVKYNDSLSPDIRGIEILDEIMEIKEFQSRLKDDLDDMKEIVLDILKQTSNDDVDIQAKYGKNNVKKQQKLQVPRSAELLSLPNTKHALKIFNYFKDTFKKPVIDTTKIEIGGDFNKFIEHLEPKFILFSTVTSITSSILSIMLYLAIFNPSLNLFGPSFDFLGGTYSITEIIIYLIVYGALIVLLMISSISWITYFRKKRKLKFRI